MIKAAVASALALLTPPPVSEDIHSDASGPPNLCEQTAPTVADLRMAIAARLRPIPSNGNPQYEAFMDGENFRSWTFTTPLHPAHPSVACRTLSDDADGQLQMGTDIRCMATRGRCDALYREFEVLDAQMRAALRGR